MPACTLISSPPLLPPMRRRLAAAHRPRICITGNPASIPRPPSHFNCSGKVPLRGELPRHLAGAPTLGHAAATLRFECLLQNLFILQSLQLQRTLQCNSGSVRRIVKRIVNFNKNALLLGMVQGRRGSGCT